MIVNRWALVACCVSAILALDTTAPKPNTPFSAPDADTKESQKNKALTDGLTDGLTKLFDERKLNLTAGKTVRKSGIGRLIGLHRDVDSDSDSDTDSDSDGEEGGEEEGGEDEDDEDDDDDDDDDVSRLERIRFLTMNGTNSSAVAPEVAAGISSPEKTATGTPSLAYKSSTATKSATKTEAQDYVRTGVPKTSSSAAPPPRISPIEESPAAKTSVVAWCVIASFALYALLG